MRVLVVYDSSYGNTAQVANAIAEAAAGGATAQSYKDCAPAALRGLDLLVVGSPTQGGRPTAALQRWLQAIPAGTLGNVAVAAFDTRVSSETRGAGLRFLMGMIGYAAPRIASRLASLGGRPVGEEGFFVEGREGPLKTGELARAGAWARTLLGAVRPRSDAA